MESKYRDIFSATFIIILSIFIIFSTKKLVAIKGLIDVGSGFFPKLIGSTLFLLGVILLIQSILVIKNSPKNQENIKANVELNVTKRSVKEIIKQCANLLTIILIFIYVLSLEKLGFVLSSSIYLFLQINILINEEKRNHLLIVIISVVSPIITYLIFTKGFGLMLPNGILRFTGVI